MVETTFEICFSADEAAWAIVESTVAGDTAQQAELVGFAHYVASVVSLLGHDRARPIVQTLSGLEEATMEHLVDLAERGGRSPADAGDREGEAVRASARFLNTRGGPRMVFRIKPRGDVQLVESVEVLLGSLLSSRATDTRYLRRLADTAGLIARLARNGQVRPGNGFDLSLAAADFAWRRGSEKELDEALPWDGEERLTCPGCGTSSSFEFRLWPSDQSAIRRCKGCGAGLWLRARRRPRLIKRDVWGTMEAIRGELGGTKQAAGESLIGDGEGGALLKGLRSAFIENRWPFLEVRGAPVLLSELSGAQGTWKFYAHAVEEQGLILLYSICPLRVPGERRSEVAQFLTRANHGLAVGNFELDFDDGEVRYKTVLQLPGDEVDSITLKRLVRANGIAMETYLPGIGAVISGTPALPALEGPTSG
jgi:hypothetical protein